MSLSERITSAHEHRLQVAYWDIGNRGIRIDPVRIAEASSIVDAEIQRNLSICSNQWGCVVFTGAENAPEETEETEEELDADPDPDADLPLGDLAGSAVNLNATRGKYSLMTKLKELGYNVPKITKKTQDGEYESNYSAGELAIQKMLSDNQFKYPGGDPALRAILSARELGKLKTSYLNARLFRRGEAFFFLSVYNVAGTLTGRRSSRRHTFGFGNNGQNFPKHSKIAYLFRRCLVPRAGNIFLFVDQIQAEDWPVSALSMNVSALQELRAGVDRHSRLATLIWGHRVPEKSDPDWSDAKYGQERYIGKKARHANNYGMKAPRFRDVLAQEASLAVTEQVCRDILNKVNHADPSVQGVFHKYVSEELSRTRTLITPAPFLRERQFLSIRPTDANSSSIKEAYAFIPQSTVGDNTGCAVLKLETEAAPEERNIVQEGHDSIAFDLPCTTSAIYAQLMRTAKAFDRTIKFHNGIEINIPIEAELGFSFDETVKIKHFSFSAVQEALQKLQESAKQMAIA